MPTFSVYFNGSFHAHIYMDYSKQQVIAKIKEDAKRMKARSFYIAYTGRNGSIYGGKSVGEWELRGTRWYRV